MSAGANPYDQIFQQPAGGPAPDPYAHLFAPPPTGSLGQIQQAIYIAEGGRKAKVPYGYAVRKPQLFGPDPWAAKPRYDEAVRQELESEQRTYEDLKRTGKIPANWDFIRYLARQGYNANPKEWHDWERNVRAHLPAAAAPTPGPARPPAAAAGVRPSGAVDAQAATRAEQMELVRQGRGYFRYGVFIPRKPQGPRAEAFQRGLASAIPGAGGYVARQQEAERVARLRADIGPEADVRTAGGRAGIRGQRPSLGEQAAGVAGSLVGFGLFTGPALGATVGRVMVRAMGGKAIAAAPAFSRFLVTIQRVAGEGAVFGTLDALIGEWDTLQRMPPAEAADHVARAAGIAGRDFAVFVGGLTGFLSVLRAGRMSLRQLRGIRADLDTLARSAAATGEVPAAEVEAIGAREARTRRVERAAAQAAAQADASIQQARQRAPTAPSERGVPLTRPAAQAPLLPTIEAVTQPALRERVPTPVQRRRAISQQEAAQREALEARLGRYYQREGEAIVLQPRVVPAVPEVVMPGAPPRAPGELVLPTPQAAPEARQLGLRPVSIRPEARPAVVPAGPPVGVPVPPEQVPLAAAPAAPPPVPTPVPAAVGEWTEVGRAKTATLAARVLADQQAKFPQLEVRARPVNTRRPKGAQVLEARSRPVDLGKAALPSEAVPAAPPTLPTPLVPAVPPAKQIAPQRGLVELTPEQKELLRQRMAATRPVEAVPAEVLPEVAPAATGRRSTVQTEAGTRVETEFALVEADSLITSHDVELRPNPRFPAELQPRERGRAASEAQVQEIASRLEPEFLGDSPQAGLGAPIRGPDSVVESGNARVIAIRRTYLEARLAPQAERYRTWLRENAASFGLTPEQVQAMREPVLVRIRRTPLDPAARVRFVQEANVAAIAELSATEQAKQDATKLTPELLDLMASGPIEAATNRPFVRAFIARVVPAQQRGRMMTTEGALSGPGVVRIRNALFAKAYGEEAAVALSRIAESTDNAIKNVSGAMMEAAPEWITLQAEARAGVVNPALVNPMVQSLMRAANALEVIRLTPETDVPAFLATKGLFAPGEIGELSVLEQRILATFHEQRRSAKALSSILMEVPKEIRMQGGALAAGQETLMALPERQLPDLERLWERAVDRAVMGGKEQLILTNRIAATLDDQARMPAEQSQAVRTAVDQAAFQFARDPTTVRGVVKIADDAWTAYSKSPQVKTHPLTQDWFRRYVRAIYSDVAEDPTGAAAARTVHSESVPLAERLDTATRNADALQRRLVRPPKVPPIGGGTDLPRRDRLYLDMKDRVRDLVEPTQQLKAASEGVVSGALRRADTILGKMGREGAELVQRKELVRRERALEAGKQLDKVFKTGLTPGQWEKIRMAREGTAIQLTEAERRAFAVADEILGTAVEASPVGRARQMGLKSEDGGEIGWIDRYWPIVADSALIERRPSVAITKIMEATGADATTAQALLNRWMARLRRGRVFSNLERRREDYLPYDLRLSALEELLIYIRGSAKRFAEVKHYGANNELAHERIAAIRNRSGPDGAFADEWFDAAQGRLPREASTDMVLAQIADVQVAAKMPLSAFSNATQRMNFLLLGSWKAFTRGWWRTVQPATREEAQSYARRTGAMIDGMLREYGAEVGLRPGGKEAPIRVGEKVLTKTRFFGSEDKNRMITAIAGREWARDLAKSLVQEQGKRPTYLRQHHVESIRRHLRKINLDPDEVVRQGGKLTDDQELLAGWTTADITQFPIGDPGSLPLWWNSPWWKIATQLSRFAYRQGVFTFNAVVEEAKHGNLKPLIAFLAVYPVVGEGVADVRLLLRRFPRSLVDPIGVLRERPRTFWRRLFQNHAYVGGLGVASNLVRAIEARTPDEAVASSLLGPTGTDVYSAIRNSLRVLRALPEGPRAAVTSPGARQLARQAVGITVTPGLAAGFGIPGAVVGEALESALRTPPRPTRRRPQRRRRR